MIGIQSIKTYTPGIPVPVHQLQEKETLSESELAYFTTCGVDTVYDSGSISSYELAKGACEKLLQETGTEASSIDLIIYLQSRMPEHFISSESTRLQHEIKAHNALSFAVSNLGCADSSMALKLARISWSRTGKRPMCLYATGISCFPITASAIPLPLSATAALPHW